MTQVERASGGKQEEWGTGGGAGGEAVGGSKVKNQTVRQGFHGSVTRQTREVGA